MQPCFSGKRFGCCAMRLKPQVFSLLLRLFRKKTKICRRKLRAIRELRWLEEGARSAYLHCINFGIIEAPTRSVFLVVATGMDTVRRGAQYPSEAYTSAPRQMANRLSYESEFRSG